MAVPTGAASSLASENISGLNRQIVWAQRLLLAAVVGLYLAAISPWWNTSADSSLYLMLGANIANGEGYTLYGEPNAFVPPGFPLIVAGMTRIGLGQMLYLNAAMALMAIAAVFMLYRMLRAAAPEQEPFGLRLAIIDSNGAPPAHLSSDAFCYDPAFACALAAALGHDMFEVATRQYSDIPFMLLAFTGLWAYERGLRGKPGLLWVGTLALATTAWFRVVGFPLIAGAVLGLVLQPRKVSRSIVFFHAGLLVAATAATLAAFYLWHQNAVQGPVPQETYAGELNRFGVFGRSPLEWLFRPFVNFWQTGEELAHVITGQLNVPHILAIVLLACPILLGMCIRLKRRDYLLLAVTVAYVGIIMLMRPLKDRYLLPVAPMLFLYFADGIRWLVERRPDRQMLAKFAVVVVLSTLAAIGAYKDVKQISMLHDTEYQEAYREPLNEAAAVLKAYHRKGEWFTTKWGENLSYVSGVPYRNLYGRFGRYAQPTGEQMLQLLEDMNIPLVVERKKLEPLPYCETMIEAVKNHPDYKLILDNKQFRIYRRLPLPERGPGGDRPAAALERQ